MNAWLCDEYSVEWALWLAAEPASTPTPSVTADIAVADEIARLQDQRDALRSGLDEVRAIVSAAKLEHPRLRHLVTGNLADQVRALVDLAITNTEADEWTRRALTAEARAEHLHAGQEAIIQAAKAAGYEYRVSAESGMTFEKEATA